MGLLDVALDDTAVAKTNLEVGERRWWGYREGVDGLDRRTAVVAVRLFDSDRREEARDLR